MQYSMSDPARQATDAFFEAMRPIEQGYQHDTFSYVATKHLGVFTLVQARLLRNTGTEPPTTLFETDTVLAGRFVIATLGISTEEFIRGALLGLISTPEGELRFPPGEAGRYAAHFEPFHHEALAMQQRLNVLRLDGATVEGYVDVIALGWHLRAAEEPYHGLEDLLFSLGLGPLREHLNIEVIATQVALIDAASNVSGTEADVGVRLANSLDPKDLRLGYRILHQGETIARASVSGRSLTWEK